MAAALATFQHHSAPRGPRTARTGGGARDELHGHAPEDALPQAAGARYFAMDAGEDVVRHQPPGGQHRCLRCCRRNGYSSAPQSRSSTLCRWSHCFMRLCRGRWNSLWTFSHLSISVLPSRLSKYPRSCVHPALLAQFSVRRRRQTVGGSADDYLLFFVIAADYGAERCHSSWGSWRAKRQSSRFSSWTAPFLSLESISEQIVEQTVDIPAACGGLADFRPGQSSSPVAHSPAAWLNPEDEPVQRVFRTFSPEEKKCD